jgi:hypothetical protein
LTSRGARAILVGKAKPPSLLTTRDAAGRVLSFALEGDAAGRKFPTRFSEDGKGDL